MLAEFYKAVEQAARDAGFPKTDAVSGDPSRLRVTNPGGGVEFVNIPAAPIKAAAGDIDSVVRLALTGAEPHFWYADDHVTGYLDDTRRDGIELALTRTPQFTALATLGTKTFDQKQFIKALRSEEYGEVDPTFLALLRKAIWRHESKSGGDIQKTKSSVGRELSASLQTEQDPPERVHLTGAKVFAEFAHGYSVECLVEIDLDNQRFQLLPLPNEIRNALDEAVRQVRAKLDVTIDLQVEDKGIDVRPQVFFGTTN